MKDNQFASGVLLFVSYLCCVVVIITCGIGISRTNLSPTNLWTTPTIHCSVESIKTLTTESMSLSVKCDLRIFELKIDCVDCQRMSKRISELQKANEYPILFQCPNSEFSVSRINPLCISFVDEVIPQNKVPEESIKRIKENTENILICSFCLLVILFFGIPLFLIRMLL